MVMKGGFILLIQILSVSHIFATNGGSKVSVGRRFLYVRVDPAEFSCEGLVDKSYSHPTSCTKFYACANQKTFKSECLPGYLFDPSSGICEIESLVYCATTKTDTTTTLAPQRTTTTVTTNTSKVDCTNQKEGTLLRNPDDCFSFYACASQGHVLIQCFTGTIFIEEKRRCDVGTIGPECRN